jgi:ABC-2 type transport system permease protein/lipopolysaccharide transport system permease protein
MNQTIQPAVSAALPDGAQADDAPPPASTSPSGEELIREQRRLAMADLKEGLLHWQLWFTIGWMDVRQRYRRSTIGPFWITLSLGIFVLGLGIVYGALFRQDLKTYLPYLATGMIVWSMIATLISEGCQTFIAAEGAIKQVPVPISTHVYRLVWRNLIIFAHNFVIYILLAAVFRIPVGLASLLAIPGLLLVGINGVGFGLILGTLSSRFRDIPLIITNLVQLVFFTTPILWRADTLPPDRIWVALANPFYFMIEIVREPLLGNLPNPNYWLVTVLITLANLAVGAALFGRFRSRLAYWL